ncbi:hypothetical protein SAMN04487928_109124 [Butyrivibrio proteoclasticus]|uniref:Uncharacterized protein n=1 Tax=Butyrivibrio proteoclasticus TaxID=43305 RepID=A0A1I5TN92_9FIRM|nr:hypothetical protein [Butyrivibrio proteoclasticus]SFP84564.1 hypothetical protein SAMN04487928_109124 [Butyrivibrio proteoclasticus]
MSKEEYQKLISDIEYIVANHCKTNDGDNYRYPVSFDGCSLGGKIEGRIPDEDYIKLEYRFGIHTLEIGKALEEIIDYFKDNYDIDEPGLFDMLDK